VGRLPGRRQRRQRDSLELTVAGRWSATPLDQGGHQPISALAGLTTRRQARDILRRSRRIAIVLNGQSQDEETVRSIGELLAQEGDLVGELVEEIVARSFQSRPPPDLTR
jgi:hypothetical protein